MFRRVSGLEEDLEKTEEKLLVANQKFDKAATAADDSERMKKVENRQIPLLKIFLTITRFCKTKPRKTRRK